MKDSKTTLVPKLRFPEFRGADGWCEQSMNEVYSFKGNNSLSRDKLNYKSGKIKNIHYGDIHTKFSTHFDITREDVPFVNESDLPANLKADNFCMAGDLIFADASEDMEDIGKAIEIIRTNGEQVVSGLHTILARQTKATLVTGFGGHLFKSTRIRAQIQRESQGSKVLGLAASRLAKIKLPFSSSTDEQQKIADCLSSLDELIAAQARKVDALKTHKKGLMQQLFPIEGETQPRLRFPEFRDAEEWGKMTLGGLVEVASGQVDPKQQPYCDMPHIGGENIESDTGNLQGVRTASELGLISGKYLFDGSYVLYSKIRPALNKVALPDFEGICSADIYPIRPSNQRLDRIYLAYLLLSDDFLKYATKHSDRSKIPKVNRDSLLAYQLLIPCRPEQQRIADCLASLDDLITAATQELETLKTHKKGLMQQLFPQNISEVTA